jgi:hypothetical protein
MIKLVYPDKKPLIKTENGKEYIFCIIRKRWFIITPEEWVRQNFILLLTVVMKYPASLIAVEKQLIINDVKKRFDIVIYKETEPYIIVECKEMNVALSESTLTQVLNYNLIMQAPYMVVTNGSFCKAFIKKENYFEEILALPYFTQ